MATHCLGRPSRWPARGARARSRWTCSIDGGDGTADPAFRALLATARARGVPIERGGRGQTLRAGGLAISVLSPPPRPPGPAAGGSEPARDRRDREQRGVRAHAVRRRREPDAGRPRPSGRGGDQGAAPRQRRSRPGGGPAQASAGGRRDRGGRELLRPSAPGHAPHARTAWSRTSGAPTATGRSGSRSRTGGCCSSRRRGRFVHSRGGRAQARLPDLRRRRREDRRLARPRPRARRARAAAPAGWSSSTARRTARRRSRLRSRP